MFEEPAPAIRFGNKGKKRRVMHNMLYHKLAPVDMVYIKNHRRSYLANSKAAHASILYKSIIVSILCKYTKIN